MPNHRTLLRRILIADDEPTVAYFLQQMLHEEGYATTIDLAASGQEAACKLQQTRYDLLITDLNMPIVSGLMLATQAREYWPDIKVILMTANDSVKAQDEIQSLKVNGYLPKPFQMSVLRDLIETIYGPDHLTTDVAYMAYLNT